MNNPSQHECQNLQERLPALCFGDIPEPEAADLHDQLAECPHCMADYLRLALALQTARGDKIRILAFTPPQREAILAAAQPARPATADTGEADELSLTEEQRQSILAAAQATTKKRLTAPPVPQKRSWAIWWQSAAAVLILSIGAMLLPSLGKARSPSVELAMGDDQAEDLKNPDSQEIVIDDGDSNPIADFFQTPMESKPKAPAAPATAAPAKSSPSPAARVSLSSDLDAAANDERKQDQERLTANGRRAEEKGLPQALSEAADEVSSQAIPNTTPSLENFRDIHFSTRETSQATGDVGVRTRDTNKALATENAELKLTVDAKAELVSQAKLAGGRQKEVLASETQDNDRRAKDDVAKKAAVGTKTNAGKPQDAAAALREEPRNSALPPGMKLCAEDAFSTFAIDVDTASFYACLGALRQGRQPTPEEVRVEEFINAFDYHYLQPAAGESFAVATEWNRHDRIAGLTQLRIGVQGLRPGADAKRSASYTFVIDTSGSMAAADRLALIQKCLPAVLAQMKPTDRFSLVTSDSRQAVLLESIPVQNKELITSAIASLRPGTGTEIAAGIMSGYELASRRYQAGCINRLILLSDGIAALHADTAKDLLERSARFRQQGIGCTVIGVGSTQHNDSFLEEFANKGDGAYYFASDEAQMNALLGRNFSAATHTIARDVKIQVEFDPALVKAWRLIGYDNRRLTKEQFRDDKVDGGEVGAGQSVTAIYEVQLQPQAAQMLAERSAGTIRVRYKDEDGVLVREIARGLRHAGIIPAADEASIAQRSALAAMQTALWLREREASGIDPARLEGSVRRLVSEHPRDERLSQLLEMIRLAQR